MSLADLAWAVEDVRKRLNGYALFRAYDVGEHRLVFATDKYRNTFGDLFREFADNMCDDVVDHMCDRLQITGWTSPDTEDAAGDSAQDAGLQVVQSSVADLAGKAWERGRGGARMGQVFRNAFREGDGFTIVQDGPDGRAGTFRQRPDQMAVRYSTESPDVIDVAAKVWKDGGRYRATLYYPDGSLERYATKGLGANGSLPQAKAFRPMELGDPGLQDGEDPMAPSGTRPGLGVFHYPNGTVSEYGRSLIAKVIPLQDALNKAVADMLVAMEFHAYPQRWATGVQVEYKPDGTERQPFAAGEGRVWRVGDKDAEMGQFDPASMEGFLDVQDGFRLEIARKGAMPAHLVNTRKGSTPPTGVAMLIAEGRAVKMARDRQRDWGYTLRDQQAYGLRLEGRNVQADDLMEQWAPPETRDMKALLEELAMKVELGVPVRQALLEMGYAPDEVAGFMSEREGEDDALQAARAAATGGRRTTVGQAQDLGIPGAPDGPGQANPLAS